jgi:hypothetical protein
LFLVKLRIKPLLISITRETKSQVKWHAEGKPISRKFFKST